MGAGERVETGTMCLTPKRPLAGESRCGMDMRQRKDNMENGKAWGFSAHHRR